MMRMYIAAILTVATYSITRSFLPYTLTSSVNAFLRHFFCFKVGFLPARNHCALSVFVTSEKTTLTLITFSQQNPRVPFDFSITFSVSNLCVTLFLLWANFPSLSLLQRHSVFHLHSCCEGRTICRPHRLTVQPFGPRHTLWFRRHATTEFECTGRLPNKISVFRKPRVFGLRNSIPALRLKVKAFCFSVQLGCLACSCESPSAPPSSWLYEREVNPDSYWITGFSIHMQAPPATQLCDSGGLSVLWKVFTGSCWCGADIYSGGGNEDSSTQVERLDCSELPEGPLSHWIQCAKFIPERVLPYSVCSANFGGLLGWSALWPCFMVTF